MASENTGRVLQWALERNPEGKLIRVTFTTEVPEYFEHLFDTDQDALLAYYHAFVNPEVELSELTDEDGAYLRRNRWNDSTQGRPAHLQQGVTPFPRQSRWLHRQPFFVSATAFRLRIAIARDVRDARGAASRKRPADRFGREQRRRLGR